MDKGIRLQKKKSLQYNLIEWMGWQKCLQGLILDENASMGWNTNVIVGIS